MSNRKTSGLIAALAFSGALFAPAVLAANRALVMAIDAYPRENALPSVALDVPMAGRIATRLGVPKENVVVRRNRQLTLRGMRAAMKHFLARVRPGDQAFVYYSGHGARVANPKARTGCTEGMVSVDGELMLDSEIADWLTTLAAKATRVVFLNDSCHSGGAITRGMTKYKAKAWKTGQPVDCGQIMNLKEVFRGPQQSVVSNTIYVAASSDDEVALAGPKGSVATLAWLGCLAGDGALNAEQLRACAQEKILADRSLPPQTITVLGDAKASLSLLPAK